MIEIASIEVYGTTVHGPFRGALELSPGLNVLSAANAYGKSLAMTAIPWCLGLETMYGLQNNDPSRFPLATRDQISLGPAGQTEVLFSFARLGLRRDDGATLMITRPIKGSSPEVVEVLEGGATPRASRLRARRETMADETGGLQRFLFRWMRLPHAKLVTLKGTEVELYLENLAPLFFIDQNEGWTDLQALQVYRYRTQEVAEGAVEYLLGARGALEARRRRQQRVSTNARLKGEAEKISEQAVEFFRRQGWELKWSTHGSPEDIAKRWSERTLGEVARDDFRMNPPTERIRLEAKLAALRDEMASDPLGSLEAAPSAQASQLVVELKTKRHSLRSELRTMRLQHADHKDLLQTIEHRIHSGEDVLRLKIEGVGRLDTAECPTCHRELDLSTFGLSDQSVPSVQVQIESLKKQRLALVRNIAELDGQIRRLGHDIEEVDGDLQNADRALESVNRSVGSARERFSKLAFDVAATQRELDALRAFAVELAELESKVARWLAEANTSAQEPTGETDLADRVRAFAEHLRAELLALGFSAINRQNTGKIGFDERYVPYLEARRLRSLGSASDHARLVAAYALALADASRAKAGPHPGFIVFDEPLQQNPDPKHRKLMLEFFQRAALSTASQIIVTTSLQPDELALLRKARVNARALPGKRFLQRKSEHREEPTPSKGE